MTSKRVKTKACVDEEQKRKNRTKSPRVGKSRVVLPRVEEGLRLYQGALSRLGKESEVAMRPLRPGQSLPEPQTVGQDQPTAGPPVGVVSAAGRARPPAGNKSSKTTAKTPISGR